MTTIFIICMFAAFIIFDIIVLIKGRSTITKIMRKWYKTMPLVPFIFGALFIGHFGLANIFPLPIPRMLGIIIFICWSLFYAVYCIVCRMKDMKCKPVHNFWYLNKRIFLIPMAFGSLCGYFWQ